MQMQGCGKGTVLQAQLQKHMELLHGWASPLAVSEPAQPKEDALETASSAERSRGAFFC